MAQTSLLARDVQRRAVLVSAIGAIACGVAVARIDVVSARASRFVCHDRFACRRDAPHGEASRRHGLPTPLSEIYRRIYGPVRNEEFSAPRPIKEPSLERIA